MNVNVCQCGKCPFCPNDVTRDFVSVTSPIGLLAVYGGRRIRLPGEPGHAHTGRAHRSAQSQLTGHTDRRNVPDQADPQTHKYTISQVTQPIRPTEARRRPDHAEHARPALTTRCQPWCQSAAADNSKGRPPPPTQNDRPPPANPTLPPPAPRAPPRVCSKAVGEMKARAADA